MTFHRGEKPPARRRIAALSAMALLGAIAAFSPAARAQQAKTAITVTDKVKVPRVKRFGINLGGCAYWGSGQILKNYVHRNPGFEGQIFQSVVRVKSGTPTGFVESDAGGRWADGFWDGAKYEVIWGKAKGRKGTIKRHIVAGGKGRGATFVFSKPGPAPAEGDYVVLRRTIAGDPTGGWWATTKGEARFEVESGDLPPATAGKRCLRVSALGPGDRANLAAYFDSSSAGGLPFLLLRGKHRLSFWAKGLGGSREIRISLRRLSNPNRRWLAKRLVLDGQWRHYEIDFDADDGLSPGTIALDFTAQKSAFLLDDVSLVGLEEKNPTVFRDAVVEALKELRPGIIRYWAGQLGESLDNQLAPPFGRLRSGYSRWSGRASDIHYSLHEFLELCEYVGADPWYVFPITFSNEEMRNLIEYLAGGPDTPYGAVRARLGHEHPWTDVFDRIHLEFGNEAWNAIFKGGTIEYPIPYGERGDELYSIARSSPFFSAAKFDLVLGGQAVYVGRNKQIQNASTHHDSFSIAPYLYHRVDEYSTVEDLFGPLFAMPEMLTRTGYIRQNYDMIRRSPHPVAMSVYEVNLHTTSGRIPQDALDKLTPSLGAGLAVACHMLNMLASCAVRDQCLFSLAGFQYRRSDKKMVRLWGVVRDLGVTNRKRPQYLAVKLCNLALRGDLVETVHTGADPTWDQAKKNGVGLKDAHFIRSYAFRDGSRRALVVFNLSRDKAFPVEIRLPSPRVAGAVRYRLVADGGLTSTNEDREEVRIVRTPEKAFSGDFTTSLPAGSMTVWTWEQR